MLTETQRQKIENLRNRMEANVRNCIMPFWRDHLIDNVHGGFYGKVNCDLTPDLQSPKSLVLNARLLWAYIRSYEMLGDEVYRKLADCAFLYIREYFVDPVYGGAYWMVTCKGEPGEIEKRTYAQAFLIYSMAQYSKVTGNQEALKMAIDTMRLLNLYVRCEDGGYADSVTRDWLTDEWVNVWIKNRGGAEKLLNSNMHLFEAILTLAETTGEPAVLEALRAQLQFILDKVFDEKLHHLKAGMLRNGTRIDNEINYGHDCECSYLITRASELLGDEELIKQARRVTAGIMDSVYSEGIDIVNGGLNYITDYVSGETNCSKIWWVQAEGITAFFNYYQLTGREKYLDTAIGIWNYVEKYMVNYEKGDWYAVGINPKADEKLRLQEEELNAVFTNREMAGKGKCPYHNSRTCYEIMERTEKILKDFELKN